jgi:WW domain-binding protein 4
MSEYWVSKKRYFCKYCDTYIADDVPSRQHHENGLRHKGNVERFVRGLYKAGEKQKKGADEEKREMMRIERVCGYSNIFPTSAPSNCCTERLPVPPLPRMLAPVARSTSPLQVRPPVQAHLLSKNPKNLVEFQITLLQSH